MKRLKMIDLKDCLVKMDGGYSWMDTYQPHSMGNPSKIRKKISYFLNKTKFGQYLTQDFNDNRDDMQHDIEMMQRYAQDYWSRFDSIVHGLDFSKYGF